jgi:hypothetical protein
MHGPVGPTGLNVKDANDAVVNGVADANVAFAPTENELLNGMVGGCFLIPIKITR